MLTVLAAIAGCLIGVVITRIMVRSEKETVKVTEFRCPYCTIEVTGAKQLDLINHVGCVMKSSEDLETMRKNAKKEEEDKYFSEIRMRKRKSGEDFSFCTVHYAEWWTYGFTIYRNGTEIFNGYASSEAAAKNRINSEIALDKHKRSTREKS